MGKTIAIVTDFGLEDHYVGVMKGVIQNINPGVCIIDVTHNVPAHDVRAGAFILKVSYRYFPRGTIFLVVVDPGVGSHRSPIAVKTKNYYFVGPDNGVLSLVVKEDRISEIVRLENKKYFRKRVSNTFHGRDIFAPVSAYISRSVPISKLGKSIKKITQLNLPLPQFKVKKLIGEVIYIDQFGNLVTNIDRPLFGKFLKKVKTVRVRPLFIGKLNGKKINAFCSAYQEGRSNQPFFIIGGSGYLEISLNQKSAQQYFKAKIGDKVKLW